MEQCETSRLKYYGPVIINAHVMIGKLSPNYRAIPEQNVLSQTDSNWQNYERAQFSNAANANGFRNSEVNITETLRDTNA